MADHKTTRAASPAHLPSAAPAAPDPDEALLRRVASGDPTAAAELVGSKLPRLISLARRLLGDTSDAEDVAQETLIRTWKQARDWIPGRARIDTWMHRVALNLCYDRLRRIRPSVNSDDIELIDTGALPGAAIERRQEAEQVRQALEGLPPRQRTAITLCYYQDMSNIEAAAAMDVTVEALESLLSRARRALRTRLSEETAVNGGAA